MNYLTQNEANEFSGFQSEGHIFAFIHLIAIFSSLLFGNIGRFHLFDRTEMKPSEKLLRVKS